MFPYRSVRSILSYFPAPKANLENNFSVCQQCTCYKCGSRNRRDTYNYVIMSRF